MEYKNMQFIDPEINHPKKKEDRPASYIRKEFDVGNGLRKATLYMTAQGIYKGFINGEELDDRLLLPGFTNYFARLQVQEYDLTRRVRPGANVIGVILGEGWYRGCLGVANNPNCYGDTLGLAAQLILSYEDGSEETVNTDSSWKATQDGPIRTNDIKTFETVDARCEFPGWKMSGFDDSAWHGVSPSSYAGCLIDTESVPVREKERFSPCVLVTPNGETVLDFGQNLAGHVEFTVSGTAGQTVKLEMGETLDENGNFTMKNLGGEGRMSFLVGQVLSYTLKDGTQTYKSQFLISGYRYVRLSDWPEPVKPENFTSIAVYSDMADAGSFSCSNEKINRFVSNSRWSWHSNSVEIPTDCPTRERAGWTGDINVFCESASYISDTKAFLHKYLGDMISHQLPNGSLPYIVPVVELAKGSMNRFANDSAGWTDAVLNVPMTLYRFYGDKSELSFVYDAAKKWIDYDIKRSLKGRNKYLLTKGFHWGEWLEPGRPMAKDAMKAFISADSEVATAWLYQSTLQLSEIAGILGKQSDESRYSELAGKVREAYRRKYLKNGTVDSDRQCRYVRPVFMGLADPEECAAIIAKLDAMVRANGYRIGTGFLTTWKILKVLCDYGYADTAYRMMENEQCPGWLYEVCKGATTTWENWEGLNERNVPNNSLNHYAPGAATAWLYSHVGGIRPAAPGFEKILIKPVPGGSLTWAKTEYNSVRGRIATSWERENGLFRLTVEIPDGSEAEIVLPDGTSNTVTAGRHVFECR